MLFLMHVIIAPDEYIYHVYIFVGSAEEWTRNASLPYKSTRKKKKKKKIFKKKKKKKF